MDYNMQTSMDGSPFMTGSWYNPATGDSFTVRDTYMEDNNIFVITTDGRRLDYEMISRYVQSDKPIEKQPKDIQQGNPPQSKEDDIPDEVKKILAETGDDALLNTPVHSTPSPLETPITPAQNIFTNSAQNQAPIDEDELLIKRMLGKCELPSIVCRIDWKKFPTKQMDMLDTMCVDVEKIANFCMSKLDLNAIREQICSDIQQYIDLQLHGEDRDTITATPFHSTTPAFEPAEVHDDVPQSELTCDTQQKVQKPVVKKVVTAKKTVKKTAKKGK